ncbi:MAG TPA: FAD-binding protein, partial [Burkholderiales bacterium]|nr:FAD-binding protein [Burkholderiales bacterium]
EEHLADFPAWAGPFAHRDNLELARLLTAHAAGALAWLRASGLEFYGPLEEPPHRKPRMHNVLPGAGAFVYHLSRRARRAGVELRLGTPALRLLRSGTRITGVETPAGCVESARGVILAGGDFNASTEFRREFASPLHLPLPAVNPGATGDCHRMAREIGGVIVNGDLAFGEPRYRFPPPARPPWWTRLPPHRALTTPMRFALQRMPGALVRPFVLGFLTTALAPEAALFAHGALLVNARGERVALDGTHLGSAIATQPNAEAFAFLDGAAIETFSRWPRYVSTAPGIAYAYIDDYRRTRPDLCTSADTLDGLARKRGMDAGCLREAAAGRAIRPPYLLLGPIRATTVLADGGLAVSTRLEVLDGAGAAIPGLYAAGATGQGGLLLRGHGHHLAWAFVSGRLAGESIAG